MASCVYSIGRAGCPGNDSAPSIPYLNAQAFGSFTTNGTAQTIAIPGLAKSTLTISAKDGAIMVVKADYLTATPDFGHFIPAGGTRHFYLSDAVTAISVIDA